MPSDKCNSLTAITTDLIFSLFDVTLAQEMPFGIPQYVQCIFMGLPVSSFVSHLSLLTVKSADLEVVHDGFPS